MSLDDFTDTDPRDDAGPEDVVKHELTQWLLQNGANAVHWEKANPWRHPTFQTNGTDRPDLLVQTDRLNFAIETKCDNSGMYRAPPQLQRYWTKYLSGSEEYRVGAEPVNPDVFVLATGNSPDGHLFEAEHNSDVLQTWEAWGGSRFPRRKGWLPDVEHNATKTTLRVMWQYAAEATDNGGGEAGIGIGALLSSRLDGDDRDRPRLLYYQDKDQCWRGIQ